MECNGKTQRVAGTGGKKEFTNLSKSSVGAANKWPFSLRLAMRNLDVRIYDHLVSSLIWHGIWSPCVES